MSNKQAVLKLTGLLAGYKKEIVIIVMYLVVSTILNFCIPLISRSIMDDGFIGGNERILMQMVLLSIIIYFVNSFIDVMKEKKRVEIAAKIQYSLSERAFLHLLKLKISYFNNMNHAEILNNISLDVNNISSVADDSVFFVVTKAFGMIGGVIGLFMIDYRLTILVLIFIPVKYLVMKYFARQNKDIMNRFIEKNEAYAKWFGDCIGGVKEVKLFSLFENKHREFSVKQKDVIENTQKMNMLSQWNSITDTIMVELLTSIIYLAGAHLVFRMQLSVGSIFAFITYSTYVTNPISSILNIGYLLSGIIPSTKRYYEFIELEEEDNKYSEKDKMEPGHIELKDVTFSYEDKSPVLNHVNMQFKEGSSTALIGGNGSGKSTVIKLLTRFCEPQQGQITLNKKNIKSFNIQNYRKNISIVNQDIYLFNDTIRNNICLYREFDDEKIIEACYDSGLESFLNEFSLDYIVGENGAMLSGGQKQKIALARALIYDAPVVILDEATSNSDVYSEMKINELLNTRLKEKTVIIVSHKTDILKKVDNIVMLKDGQVCGSGPYEKLYKNNRYFYQMIECSS